MTTLALSALIDATPRLLERLARYVSEFLKRQDIPRAVVAGLGAN
jgi:hypothetical protein